MEQMEYGSYSLGERKGGVFQTENVKNEDLELHNYYCYSRWYISIS